MGGALAGPPREAPSRFAGRRSGGLPLRVLRTYFSSEDTTFVKLLHSALWNPPGFLDFRDFQLRLPDPPLNLTNLFFDMRPCRRIAQPAPDLREIPDGGLEGGKNVIGEVHMFFRCPKYNMSISTGNSVYVLFY